MTNKIILQDDQFTVEIETTIFSEIYHIKDHKNGGGALKHSKEAAIEYMDRRRN